jgi:sulfur-carrier protein
MCCAMGQDASMARVTLIGPLKAAAGADGTFEIDARTVRQLLTALAARFPTLQELIEDGVAVAIDGQIYQDALFAEIKPDSDVHILPPIAGG